MPGLAQQILALIRSRGRITIGEVVIITGANRNTIKKQLEILSKDQYIHKYGTTKGAWYALNVTPRH